MDKHVLSTPSSTTPTDPQNLCTTPCVHLFQTQNNTSGKLSAVPLATLSTSKGAPPIFPEMTFKGGCEPTSKGGHASEEWYSQPCPKQKQTQHERQKPTRRSPQLYPQPNSPREDEETGDTRKWDQVSILNSDYEPLITTKIPMPKQPPIPLNVFNKIKQDTTIPITAPEMDPVPSLCVTSIDLSPPSRLSCIITQEASNYITHKVWNETDNWSVPYILERVTPTTTAIPDLEHICTPIMHPVTGKITTKYQKLAKDTVTRKTWTMLSGKTIGNMTQGNKHTNTPVMSTIFVMEHEQIANIPKDRVVTYPQLVVDFCLQKKDPNRVRMTAGGN